MLAGSLGRVLLVGGLNGLKPSRFCVGAGWFVPRDVSRIFPPSLGRVLFVGGVKVRNPPRFSTGAAWLVPRGDSADGDNVLFPCSVERVLPEGGVKVRDPPRSTGCEVVPRGDVTERFAFVLPVGGPKPPRVFVAGTGSRLEAVLPPKLLTSRLAGIPALGRCIEFPLCAANWLAFRPPAGIAPTWLCCIVCRKLAVCCWNETGRAMLL